jgi:hypothetical protein
VNATLVEEIEQHISLAAGNRDVEITRQPIGGVSAQNNVGMGAVDSCPESITQTRQRRRLVNSGSLAHLECRGKCESPGNVESPRAQSLLVTTVVE